MGRLRNRGVLVVLLLLAVVNLPFVHGSYVDWQVDRHGVDVTATVTETQPASNGGLVQFRFDDEVDPDQTEWTAALDDDAYARAVADRTLPVVVVPGSPNRYRAVGEQGAGLLLVLTAVADVFLLLALVLMLRRRPGGARVLELVALEDVRRARPGGSVEQLSPTAYLVTGEVTLIEADAVTLDAGDRIVRVALAGFDNPVGYEQPAQVRAGLPESSA